MWVEKPNVRLKKKFLLIKICTRKGHPHFCEWPSGTLLCPNNITFGFELSNNFISQQLVNEINLPFSCHHWCTCKAISSIAVNVAALFYLKEFHVH